MQLQPELDVAQLDQVDHTTCEPSSDKADGQRWHDLELCECDDGLDKYSSLEVSPVNLREPLGYEACTVFKYLPARASCMMQKT